MASATPRAPTLDFGRSFTYVAEDPDWIRKVLIGGAFTLAASVLVGVPFVLGYFARTLLGVVEGAPRPLPEWDDLGGLFSEGLRLTAVYLVYAVGGLLLAAVPCCVFMVPALIAAGSRHGESAAAALFAVGMVFFYGLTMLLSLLLLVYVPAALMRTALSGRVADGLAWREVFAFLRQNPGNYALAILSFLLAGLVAQFGVFVCCVGVFPAAFWSYLVLAVSLAQAVRLSSGAR